MKTEVVRSIAQGTAPRDDGWDAFYRLVEAVAPRGTHRRRLLCAYYAPCHFERAGRGRLFRGLGVPAFGRLIPTGGITVRRWTGARMAPYTLSAPTLRAARDFYYRACVFETLHLPFLLALIALALQRASIGRLDYAVQETVLNLLFNVYPILHHRNTRRRIIDLLIRKGRRR
jgi:hypothetical protein